MILSKLKNILKSSFHSYENLSPENAFSEKDDFQDERSLMESKEAEYYANLEVPPKSNIEEIRKGYKKLVKLYHPDKFQNDPEKKLLAEEITYRLNEAYCYLEKKFRDNP